MCQAPKAVHMYQYISSSHDPLQEPGFSEKQSRRTCPRSRRWQRAEPDLNPSVSDARTLNGLFPGRWGLAHVTYDFFLLLPRLFL